MTSRMYHPKEKKKYNQEPLAVARLLFLTSNLQLPPPTIYTLLPAMSFVRSLVEFERCCEFSNLRDGHMTDG